MGTDLLINKEFILKQQSDILSITAKTFLNILVSVKDIKTEIDSIDHTNQLLAWRKLNFSSDGKVIIKCEYTGLGLKILKLFDCELDSITEHEFSYKIDNTDENAPKITLYHADGLIYGSYFCDKSFSAIKTSDYFSTETYINGTVEPEVIEFIAATQPDMQKAGCWFRWLSPQSPYKWNDSYGTAYMDVKYGDRERNVLDVYVPKGFDKNRENGIIISIHGGGWTVGDKSSKSGTAAHLAEHGYFTVALNYSFISLENKISMFTIFDEIATAVAKVKSMSDEYGWNITKAATFGESAGGHLSLMHAYAQNGRGGIPVLFAATEAGPIDMRPSFWQNLTSTPPEEVLRFASAGTGQQMTLDEAKSGKYVDLIMKISPINFADSAVPTLIMQGLLDASVNPETGKVLHDALKKRNIRNDYVAFPNSNHGGALDAHCRRRFDSLFLQYAKEYFGY